MLAIDALSLGIMDPMPTVLFQVCLCQRFLEYGLWSGWSIRL